MQHTTYLIDSSMSDRFIQLFPDLCTVQSNANTMPKTSSRLPPRAPAHHPQHPRARAHTRRRPLRFGLVRDLFVFVVDGSTHACAYHRVVSQPAAHDRIPPPPLTQVHRESPRARPRAHHSGGGAHRGPARSVAAASGGDPLEPADAAYRAHPPRGTNAVVVVEHLRACIHGCWNGGVRVTGSIDMGFSQSVGFDDLLPR